MNKNLKIAYSNFEKNRKEKQKSEENGAVVERNLFTIF